MNELTYTDAMARLEARRTNRRALIQGGLFLCTVITTTSAGALQNGVNPLTDPWGLLSGIPFAATLMLILLVHEMGHYLTARYHGVAATLPYFIPAPSIIGTFGAFIKMETSPWNRRVLFDVGAAGPIAGLVLAIPAIVIGLGLSTVSVDYQAGGGLSLGSSLVFSLLSQLTLGVVPEEAHILLHPVAFAGWIGLLVTALNLLPVGQLDGGHVVYALFGRRQVWVSRLALVVIVGLAVMGYWEGWIFWAVLLVVMGLRHPPTIDDITPLDPKRKLAAWGTLVLLGLIFTPAPFYFAEPESYRPVNESIQNVQRLTRSTSDTG